MKVDPVVEEAVRVYLSGLPAFVIPDPPLLVADEPFRWSVAPGLEVRLGRPA